MGKEDQVQKTRSLLCPEGVIAGGRYKPRPRAEDRSKSMGVDP